MATILILNTGSTTLKWSLFSKDRELLDEGIQDWSREAHSHKAEIETTLHSLPKCEAVGHRVVHGGNFFTESLIIDRETRTELDRLAALDPLHMNPALAAIDAARAVFPQAYQVAAFDTAFHSTLTETAGYALPREWTRKWQLRRFGFHGLSVIWSLQWARRRLGRLPQRVIVAHLGSGCSMTAIKDGVSVDTTMGFSPLDGLMMATRSGSVDPGLLIHLQARCGVSLELLEDTLTHRSGLLGVSGLSADMREIIAAADAGHANARLAYQQFIFHARRGLGSMFGTLGGADLLIFTGGIAEHQPRVRRDIAAALGVDVIEPVLNERSMEGLISGENSPVRVLLVHACEDRIILADVLRLLDKRLG